MLALTAQSPTTQSVICFSFPLQKKWYLKEGVPCAAFVTLPVCRNKLVTITNYTNCCCLPMISFPGFSCLQATIAWGGPHSMGHSVFHTALTQMYKTLLVFFSSPFSHNRGTIHACMINNCIHTHANCEFTIVGMYLNYAPTLPGIFFEFSTTLAIGQFCFNPSTIKFG